MPATHPTTSSFQRPGRLLPVALLIVMALALAACGSTNTATRNANTDPNTRDVVDVVAETRSIFESEMTLLPVGNFDGAVSNAFERLAVDNKIHNVTRAFYEDRDYKPLFLVDGTWTDDAENMVAALATADQHAMEKVYPDPATFADARNRLTEVADSLAELRHFQPTEQEWTAVVVALEKENLDPSDPAAVDHLIERLTSSGADNPMPRLAKRIATLQTTSVEFAELIGDTEARLAFAAGTWAHEMRLGWHQNTARLNPFKKWARKDTRYRARMRAWFGHLGEVGAESALASLAPRHPQYAMLVDARQFYADIAMEGGWGEVQIPKLKKLRKDRKHDGLETLKQRLMIEGYDPGPIDTAYNDEVDAAVKAYQRTHQLKDDGEIDGKLIKNLNLPVEDRLAKIDVTLRRYRKTPVGMFDEYVLVNIPDFHAEVWRQGERKMRFGIVVGNNKIQRDPVTNKVVKDDRTGEVIRPNRTPIQTAFIKYVIYNPYWNVPSRIREEELEVELAADPTYYERNNFEVVNPDNPRLMYVRERPGPGNTLGRVKFIFPNKHDVFLHDTQHHGLFRRPVRAYSHGCMRVSKPMEFAQHLLEEDGQWDKKRVREVLRTEPYEETAIRLKEQVPIHIDYFNTRVDDEGRVHFLSDIYDYDKPKFTKRTAELQQMFGEQSASAQAQ